MTGSLGKVNVDRKDRKITRKITRKKGTKVRIFVLNKDTSLAKMEEHTFRLTWL